MFYNIVFSWYSFRMHYFDERDSRFSNWNSTSGYYDKESILSSSILRTDSSRNLQDTQKFLKSSVDISSKLFRANKNQVLKADAPGSKLHGSNTSLTSKASLKSTQSTSFINPRSWRTILAEKYDSSMWLTSFEKFVKPFKKNPTSLDGSLLLDQSILLTDVSNVVFDCLGADAPSFLVEKFAKLSSEVAKERRVTWHQFSWVVVIWDEFHFPF